MPADASSSGASRPLNSNVFLELVSEVLEAENRGTLPGRGSPQQRIITIEPTDRVLQILAGPGSGKTEVLVWRVLYELFVNGTLSQNVMVTTFTRRAATELQVRLVERSDALLRAAQSRSLALKDPQVHDLRIGTIHALCDSLLAEFDTSHVERGTQMIDETETSVRVARDHRYALGYNDSAKPARVLNRLLSNPALTTLFRPAWDDSARWPGNMMERTACILAILNQHTETWIPRCEAATKANGIEAVHGYEGLTDDLVKLQGRWEEYLDKHNILDFATIQKRFLSQQTLVADSLAHVFVDEFQDNNPIQFAIHTGWLARPGMRLTVVGDDDQAIYRFRGSDIECFNQLDRHCRKQKIPFRIEKLETNYRSTQRIVTFTQSFRMGSALGPLSMQKRVMAASAARKGGAVRLLEGPWPSVANCVAAELKKLAAGTVPGVGVGQSPPSAAVLMFSTSERQSSRSSPAKVLRESLEAAGVRTYNPRNKTAAAAESPVSQLLGLISYLIDPISYAPAGRNGRTVMVAASMDGAEKQAHARTLPPPFFVNKSHLDFQKKFFKLGNGDIGSPDSVRVPLVELVDCIRTNLAKVCGGGDTPRLTLAGFVSRLLALPYFRNCGFTPNLFRQALFTKLVEANIAPTRLTLQSLDQPLEVKRIKGKYEWPDRFWRLLSIFGAYLDNAPIDDPEVESFEDHAVLLLTFHQTKGLEFDHVYVAGTGRAPDLGPALRTKLFSGATPKYQTDGGLSTKDKQISRLALADRDREVYVALTRAKKSLTILSDPKADLYMALNPAIAQLFASAKVKVHAQDKSVTIKETDSHD